MLPGPILYLFCPKCHVITTRPTLSSGNTFGARRWTDGKMIAPMLPEYADIIKCMNCRSFFWIDDVEMKAWDWWESAEEGTTVPDWVKQIGRTYNARSLTIEEYIEAINRNVANTRKREKYLRIRLWWAYNDHLRELTSEWWAYNNYLREPTFAGFDIQNDYSYRDNLQKLEDILDENVLDERIMKAEANRELGNFNRAIELFEHTYTELRVYEKEYFEDPINQLLGDTPGQLREIADLIIKLAKHKDSKVREIV